MNSLQHRRGLSNALRELVESAPIESTTITDDQRARFASKFRGLGGNQRTLIDAWAVESSGRAPSAFRWRPSNARRCIGSSALRRLSREPSSSVVTAVRDEIDELLVRSAAGYARPGSLAHWLARQRPVVVARVSAEAITWASTVMETIDPSGLSWRTVPADAYYDVAGARTTLKGRRDATIDVDTGRVLVRLRGGQPGRFAGAGLRADLVVDALSEPSGRASQRIVGLWPDAGVALSVDATFDSVRGGANDLVRAAMTRRCEQQAA